jgi:Zn ribbon nucleic-acid-binding protein
MPPFRNVAYGLPPCPTCQMAMIVVDGYNLDLELKGFECLQCGHVEKPATSQVLKRRPAASCDLAIGKSAR